MKRVFSVLLVVCMLVSVAPVFAANYQGQDLSSIEWFGYDDCGSGAEGNRTSTATPLDDTTHGAGYTISKPVTKDEFTNFNFIKTGTVNLPKPISIEEDVITTVEFWYKVNNTHEGWAPTALLINDKHAFGVTDGMTYGRATGDQYLYANFNEEKYIANTWVNIKLELKPSTYHPWNQGPDGQYYEDKETNLPCTGYTTYKRNSAEEQWQQEPHGGGRLGADYKQIESISTGFAVFNTEKKPEDLSGSIDISVAGLKVYQNVSITDDGWRGFDTVKYTGIGNDGVSVGTNNIQSAYKGSTVEAVTNAQTGHGDGIKATKQVSVTPAESTSFKTMPIATKTFSNPVVIDGSKHTIMEFSMKADGISQTQDAQTQGFANAHLFINNDAYFSILPEGKLGYRSLNYSEEWTNQFYPDHFVNEDGWVDVKLEMIAGTKEVEGSGSVPCTHVSTNIKNDSGEWVNINTQGIRVNHENISTISVGYSTNYNKNVLYDDKIDIYLTNLKIYREGEEPADPADTHWHAYDAIEGITSDFSGSKISGLSNASTGHGAGLKVSKQFSANEDSHGLKKLASVNLATPVTIGSDKSTFVEFWYRDNGAAKNWANSIIMVNDEPMFGVSSNSSLGQANGENYGMEWYRFNNAYPTNEWVHVKVELNQGTYHPWGQDDVDVPGTIVYPVVTLSTGTDQPWRRDGHFTNVQNEINSISVAYQSDKIPGDHDIAPGEIDIDIAGLKIYRDGEAEVIPPTPEVTDEPEPPVDPPVKDTDWTGYDNVQRVDKDQQPNYVLADIGSADKTSRVAALTTGETDNHGEGVKISKTVDPTEWLQFSFAKLGTKTFGEPIKITEDDLTTVEFWIKNEGRSQTGMVEEVSKTVSLWSTHFFINDEPVFAMLDSGNIGRFETDWTLGYASPYRWGDNYKIPDGVWTKVKLDFKKDMHEGSPCTKMIVSVLGEEGVSEKANEWVTYGEMVLKYNYDQIESVSFGYSKSSSAPIITSDLDIYVADFKVQRTPHAGGWYGNNNLTEGNGADFIKTGANGRVSYVSLTEDGTVKASKSVSTKEDIGFEYRILATTELAEPIIISEDEANPTNVEISLGSSGIVGTDWANAVLFINDQPITAIQSNGEVGYADFDKTYITQLISNFNVADEEMITFSLDLFQSVTNDRNFAGEIENPALECTAVQTKVKKDGADWVSESPFYDGTDKRHLNVKQTEIRSISVGYKQSFDGAAGHNKYPAAAGEIGILVDGLKINGQDPYKDLSIDEAGKTATYSVRAFDTVENTAAMMLAVYDSNGVLINVIPKAISLTANEQELNEIKGSVLSDSISFSDLPTGAASVKAYVWDALTGMVPLTSAAGCTVN